MPHAVTFPTSGVITYGQRLSESALTGKTGDGIFTWKDPDTFPPVQNAGYEVVFTPNDTANYDYSSIELERIVTVTVVKETPQSVIFPESGAITFGQKLSESSLSGASGDGIFIWKFPDTVPPVSNAGFTIVFVPDDADNYDYSNIKLERIVSVAVAKAIPSSVIFPTSGVITYGQRLSDSSLSGGIGDGIFTWKDPDTFPPVQNAGYGVVFTPDDSDNMDYSNVILEKTVSIDVKKADQNLLSVSGISDSITLDDAPFDMTVTGGSGEGGLSFEVTSGDAVTVSPEGRIMIVSVGTAKITITKAESAGYLKGILIVEINVSAAAPTTTPTPTGTPTPTSTPTPTGTPTPTTTPTPTGTPQPTTSPAPTGTPTPTSTPAPTETQAPVITPVPISSPTLTPTPAPSSTATSTPTPTPAPAQTQPPSVITGGPSVTPQGVAQPGRPSNLTPAITEYNDDSGVIIFEINSNDLPNGTMSIKMSNGKIIRITDTLGAFRLEINIDDLNEKGALAIIALDKESESLGSYNIQITNEKGQIDVPVNKDGGNNGIPTVLWVIIGIALVGGIGAAAYVTLKRHRVL